MQKTCQFWRYLWITWEIYANVSTNNTGSWRFITAKEYRNTYRVYLVHRGETSEIMYHIRQLKENADNRYTPAHAWNVEPALFLFPEACSGTQQSESLLPASHAPNRTKHRLYKLFVRCSKYKFLYNSMDSATTKERSTDHGPILQLHRKAYLHQTLCFHHGTSDHFSTIQRKLFIWKMHSLNP
jgi:hypothetical protein